MLHMQLQSILTRLLFNTSNLSSIAHQLPTDDSGSFLSNQSLLLQEEERIECKCDPF
jgi:hypothetical protein